MYEDSPAQDPFPKVPPEAQKVFVLTSTPLTVLSPRLMIAPHTGLSDPSSLARLFSTLSRMSTELNSGDEKRKQKEREEVRRSFRSGGNWDKIVLTLKESC